MCARVNHPDKPAGGRIAGRAFGGFRLGVALSVIWVSLSPFSPAAHTATAPLPSAPEVRKAVERSLPFLMNRGEAWKARTFGAKKIQCVSCHQVPFAVWTHNEAKARGFAVDQAKMDTLADWMIGFSDEKSYSSEMVDGFLDTMMLVRETWPDAQKDGRTLEMFQRLLAEQQRPDGSWMLRDGTTPNEDEPPAPPTPPAP